MNPSPLCIAPQRRPAATRSGLALVELVVLLVVFAAIAVVAVPRLGRAEADPLGASVRGDLAVLRNAIELYAADHSGAYPPLKGFEAALTRPLNGQGPYLQAVPGLAAQNPEAAAAPRVSSFASAHATPGSTFDIAWFYDEKTGRIRHNTSAGR